MVPIWLNGPYCHIGEEADVLHNVYLWHGLVLVGDIGRAFYFATRDDAGAMLLDLLNEQRTGLGISHLKIVFHDINVVLLIRADGSLNVARFERVPTSVDGSVGTVETKDVLERILSATATVRPASQGLQVDVRFASGTDCEIPLNDERVARDLLLDCLRKSSLPQSSQWLVEFTEAWKVD